MLQPAHGPQPPIEPVEQESMTYIEPLEADPESEHRVNGKEEPEELLQAPRHIQLGVIAVYPALLAIGSVASLTAPVSYFGNKRNVFNQIFIKRGWLWFTLVFWTSYFGRNVHARRPVGHVAARYIAATLWWILFTQWCFGAPLMDKIFLLTGGSCDVASSKTSAGCRRSGGSWIGGHDPSGHVFLIVQSSLAMWMEILPALWHRFTSATAPTLNWGVNVPLVFLALWAWMLVMTGIYFHSFLEKLTGLLFGTVEVLVVYVWGESRSWGSLFGVTR